MTVSTTAPTVTYTWTATLPDDYDFAYQILQKSDVRVQLKQTDGTRTDLVVDTDFTVAFNGDNTGTVTVLASTLVNSVTATTTDIVIRRSMVIEQSRNLVSGQSLDLELIERVFDEVIMILQQQEQDLVLPLELVASDIDDINLIVDNLAALLAVSADLSDILAVNADQADIGLVAAIEAQIGILGGLSAEITTLAGVSADITTVAANLSDILAALGSLSAMTTTLPLTVNGLTSVPGVSYETLEEARVYANLALQSGGTLNITIPAATLIEEVGDVSFDLTRYNVNIIGSGKASSGITRPDYVGNDLTFTGPGKVTFTDVYIYDDAGGIGDSGGVTAFNDCDVVFTDSKIETVNTWGTAIFTGSNVNLTASGSDFIAPKTLSIFTAQSTLHLTNCLFRMTEAGGTRYAMTCHEDTRVYSNACEMDVVDTSGSATAWRMKTGSRHVCTSPVFTGFVDIQYTPAADVFSDFQSINITV